MHNWTLRRINKFKHVNSECSIENVCSFVAIWKIEINDFLSFQNPLIDHYKRQKKTSSLPVVSFTNDETINSFSYHGSVNIK